jgi:hypothetical protein
MGFYHSVRRRHVIIQSKAGRSTENADGLARRGRRIFVRTCGCLRTPGALRCRTAGSTVKRPQNLPPGTGFDPARGRFTWSPGPALIALTHRYRDRNQALSDLYRSSVRALPPGQRRSHF